MDHALFTLLPGLSQPGAAPPAAGAAETTGIFLALLILLLAAKLGEEVFRRLGQPGIVGELIGGFVVGPYALGLVGATTLEPGGAVAVFAELGAVTERDYRSAAAVLRGSPGGPT